MAGLIKLTDINDLAEKFLQFAQVSASSIKAYRKGIKNLANFFKLNRVTSPTRENFIEYREYLSDKYAAATCNLYLTSAKLFFNFLSVEGYIAKNPCEHLKGVKIDNSTHKKDSLSSDMVKNILANFDRSTLQGKRDCAMFALMVTAGLRTIEISRADVADIELRGEKYYLYVLGKGRTSKSECIEIASGVYSLIEDYLKARDDKGESLFASVSRRNYGGRLTTISISRAVKTAMIRAGYSSKRLSAHSLRHTAATVALMSGATLRQVQQVLRHRNISVTTIYLHDLDRMTNNAECLVAKAFGL